MLKKTYTFDDVALVPQYNNISSRLEPDLSTWLCSDLKMDIPILAANMDTVIGDELADVLIKYGSYPIFHRFTDFETQIKWVNKYIDKIFISAGLEDFDKAVQLLDLGAKGVCMDIAHSHDQRILKFLNKLANHLHTKGLSDRKIICGNVCTVGGYIDLCNAGASAVKCGVGPGSACTTRMVTGFGVPQFTAIQDCAAVAKKYSVPVIADGGITGSADIVKALAAGACSVMIGKMFALTEESSAEKRKTKFIGTAANPPKNYLESRFRGQASEEFQNDFKGGLKKGTVAEGESFWAPVTGSASQLLDNLLGGIRSGFTYGGARTIKELQRKAEFVEVISNSYSKESNTRKD